MKPLTPGKMKKEQHGEEITLPTPLSCCLHDVPVEDMAKRIERSMDDRRRESARRHGNIARPMNSFMLYRLAHLKRAQKLCSNSSGQSLSHILSCSWREEDPQVRRRYVEYAKIEKVNHQNAHPEYKFSPRKIDRIVESEHVGDPDLTEHAWPEQGSRTSLGIHRIRRSDALYPGCNEIYNPDWPSPTPDLHLAQLQEQMVPMQFHYDRASGWLATARLLYHQAEHAAPPTLQPIVDIGAECKAEAMEPASSDEGGSSCTSMELNEMMVSDSDARYPSPVVDGMRSGLHQGYFTADTLQIHTWRFDTGMVRHRAADGEVVLGASLEDRQFPCASSRETYWGTQVASWT